jgi:hypothetical protein
VSAGAGAGAGVASGAGAAIAAESAFSVLASPPPLQDAAKRPNARANTLNFTNFIPFVFWMLYLFIRYLKKGNPLGKKNFKYFLFLCNPLFWTDVCPLKQA